MPNIVDGFKPFNFESDIWGHGAGSSGVNDKGGYHSHGVEPKRKPKIGLLVGTF